MSGKKLSDVTNSISTHIRSCEGEVNAAKTKVARVPRQKRIKPSTKFNKKLINTYFPGVFDKQILLRQKLQEQYEAKHQDAASLIKSIKQLSSVPKSILKDLQKLHDKVLKSGRVHNMDNEFFAAEDLGTKLRHWKDNMRNLSNQLERAVFSGTSIDEIYQSIALIDKQLIGMEKQSIKLDKAEKLEKQREDLFNECSNEINKIDKSFVDKFMNPEIPVLDRLEILVNNPKSSIRQLKKALSQLSSFSTQVSDKQKAMEAERVSLDSAIKDISHSIESLQAFDPVQQKEVSASLFYQSYGSDKLDSISNIKASLSQASDLLSNLELLKARRLISQQRESLEAISEVLRDDTNTVVELVDRALTIRSTLTEKGLAGGGNLDIGLDQLLNKGILIKTMVPKNTYFQINPDGSLEANVDSISASCVKGMADFTDALANQGFIVNPKNWNMPQQSHINESSEDVENLNKTS